MKRKTIFIVAAFLIIVAAAAIQPQEVRYFLGFDRAPGADQAWAHLNTGSPRNVRGEEVK
jgi:hypothetical protein